MPSLLDQRQVRRGFDRAAAGFDAAAALPGEVRARLLGSLDYLDDTVPAVVLDLGSGTGHAAAAMKKRWPKSQVLAPPFDPYTDLLLKSVPEMEIGWLERVLAGRRMESAGK